MYSYKIKQAIESANDDYSKLMDIATNSNQKKQPEEEAIENRWLLAEGFVPIITPQKEKKWVPKPKHSTDSIQNYQKGMNSLSNESIVALYPFMQYAIDNYVPVVGDLVSKVLNGDHSQQYLSEMLLKLKIEGIKEAVNATGGIEKQGNNQLGNSANIYQTAAILSSSPKAVKALGGGDNGD